MMKGSHKDEGTDKKFIVHQGEMTDDELFEASKKRREKKGLKN